MSSERVLPPGSQGLAHQDFGLHMLGYRWRSRDQGTLAMVTTDQSVHCLLVRLLHNFGPSIICQSFRAFLWEHTNAIVLIIYFIYSAFRRILVFVQLLYPLTHPHISVSPNPVPVMHSNPLPNKKIYYSIQCQNGKITPKKHIP